MNLAFVMFTIVAGVMSALESGSNNVLQKTLRTPWWSIVIVCSVTLMAAIKATLIARERLPDKAFITDLPWYGWTGGLFAMVFVAATIFASPKLGAGIFVALVVTASTLTSLVLDHYGLMQFPVHEAGWGRIAGGALMAIGVALIAAF